MAANVYGLRLLTDPVGRRAIGVVVLAVLVLYRLAEYLATPPTTFGFDFGAYWLAARHLLTGQSIYSAAQVAGPYSPQVQGAFLYPPPLAALVVPLAAVFPKSAVLAAVVWSVLGTLAATAGIVLITRSEHLGQRDPAIAGSRVWLLVGLALALPPVIDEFINGNVHLFLVGLLAVAWWGIRRGDSKGDRAAGVAIGIATVIKVFPALILLWFALTGRWRAVAWSAIGAIVLSLATLPVTGAQSWLDYPTVFLNLSAPVDNRASFAPTVWLMPLVGFGLARVVVVLSALAITIWAARRTDPRTGFAITIMAALLVTPGLWSHYLTVTLVPFVLALAAGVSTLGLGVVYVLMSAGDQAALGDWAWVTIRLLPTLGVLLLTGLLIAYGRRRGRASAPAVVPPA